MHCQHQLVALHLQNQLQLAQRLIESLSERAEKREFDEEVTNIAVKAMLREREELRTKLGELAKELQGRNLDHLVDDIIEVLR